MALSPANVREGATVLVRWTIDGYPGTVAPTLAFTLADGTPWSVALAPVHAAVTGTLGTDRQTVTLGASINTPAPVAGDIGMVWVKADGLVYEARARVASGTRLVLTAPLPTNASAVAIAWATYEATVGPDDDGPTSSVPLAGTTPVPLDGTVTYTVLAPDASDEERVDTVSLRVLRRQFWTGLTLPELMRVLAGYDQRHGGQLELTRWGSGSAQGLIENTLDELVAMVEDALPDGTRLDDVVGIGPGLLAAHVLLVRADRIEDRSHAAELQERARRMVAVKLRALAVDTDNDGVVDEVVQGGYRNPASMGTAQTTTPVFNMTRLP